jgi:TPR repeat protein
MWFVIIVLAIVGILWFGVKASKDADAKAEDGTPEEQFSRGENYLTYDLEKAKYWFEKAANQGSSSAKARLKIITLAEFNNCMRIERDGEGEKIYNSLMTLSNNPKHWSSIGETYFNGAVLSNKDILYLVHGLEPDMEKAEYWFKKAADNGDARGAAGLYELGMRYLLDDTDSANVKRAHELLSYAAKCGSEDARMALDL